MKQPLLDFTAAQVAPQRITMEPAAIQSRRSGLRAARAKATPQMHEYKACLKAIGPASDQEISRVLGWPIATTNARRGDWLEMQPGCIGTRGRMQITHPDGRKTSRTLWCWVGQEHTA